MTRADKMKAEILRKDLKMYGDGHMELQTEGRSWYVLHNGEVIYADLPDGVWGFVRGWATAINHERRRIMMEQILNKHQEGETQCPCSGGGRQPLPPHSYKSAIRLL